jgi:ABC-type oligopeptide transport system substrate-binding subunit
MRKMQKAGKLAALIVIAAMLALTVLGAAGCGKRDEDDKGAFILMYLGYDPTYFNLDPGLLIYDAEAVKYIGIMFEGLTTLDERGRIQWGMAAGRPLIIMDDDKGEYMMEFDLKFSKWSDGTQVTAQDFVYSWKRILEPESSSPAAALLYDIKNARNVKEGYMTVDDLGVFAEDLTILRIEFEHRIDTDRFLRTLASPALVPLRDDTVEFIDPESGHSWTQNTMAFLTNGPFDIKSMDPGGIYMFERSEYYLQPDGQRNPNIFRFVTPYRLQQDMTRTLDDLTNAFLNFSSSDPIFYLGGLPQGRFDELRSRAETRDLLSSYTYYFNADKAPFNNPSVRRALSIALDRNEIARIAGLGVKPATGIVPHGILDVNARNNNEEFRTVRGGVINTSADVAEARRLLAGATGSFNITVRDSRPREVAVANYAAGVWRDLGFTVNVVVLRDADCETMECEVCADRNAVCEWAGKPGFGAVVNSRSYDVIGYDNVALGVDAWSVLAPFAKPFCGNLIEFTDVVEFTGDDLAIIHPFITGFQDDAYDAIIEDIFANYAVDTAGRNSKLFEAEQMLVNLAPVAPLYFNVSVNISGNGFRGLAYSKFGFTNFNGGTLRNYHQFITTTENPRRAAQQEEAQQ